MMNNILKKFGKIELFGPKAEVSQIGLDIGSQAIKYVELSKERDGLKIKNLFYKKISAPYNDNRLSALKEVIFKTKITGKEVNTALSGPSVVVRFIELPHMTPEELKNAIPFEAEKYLPFTIDEVFIDHQLLQPRIGTENKMRVLLAAAKKAAVYERAKMIAEAGLSIGMLDIASFANVNAFLNSADRDKAGASALIDIGATATDINILDEGILYFSRVIQLGGNDITKSISEAMSVDLAAAEDMKLNPGARSDKVDEKMKAILHNIIDEVRLSFSYYENQSGKGIESAFLTGGGARINEVSGLFKETLDIEVAQWDPIAGMEIDPAIDKELLSRIKDQLGVAIGLALR
ncbi:MAG: type IV pilus assembly protein PilM [Candidatus Omnitrophica bacterium]|nr:type IV pilus assembly protein PilM [Candidatus Omnitrophota bacterium]